MNNRAIYTINIGGYDEISPLPNKFKQNWDAYLITDDPDEKVNGWQTRVFDSTKFNELNIEPDVVNSRHPKFNPHLYFADYDYTLYIDGNREVIGCLDELYNRYKDYKFVVMPHVNSDYDNIYSEIRTCIRHPRGYLRNRGEKLLNCIKDYKNELFPCLASPKLDNSTIFRHKNARYINELIWQEFLNRKIYRDQIATRYILWKYNLFNEVKIAENHFCKFPSRSSNGNEIFKYKSHNKKARRM